MVDISQFPVHPILVVFAFVMNMLGTHNSQQQPTPTKRYTIPELIFRLRFLNPTEKSKVPDNIIFIVLLAIVSVRIALLDVSLTALRSLGRNGLS